MCSEGRQPWGHSRKLSMHSPGVRGNLGTPVASPPQTAGRSLIPLVSKRPAFGGSFKIGHLLFSEARRAMGHILQNKAKIQIPEFNANKS